MAVCQRCGKGEAEWQCQTCGRVVDTECARPTDKGVYCADHEPGKEAARGGWGEGSKSLKQLFVMLLFLTAGLMLIVYTGDFLLGSILKGITDTTGLSQLLKGAGWSIVYGMAGLTMIIGLGWLLTKRRPK